MGEAHFLFVSVPAWGHARPLLGLALNLARMFEELSITFVCLANFSKNIQGEIEMQDLPDELQARVHIAAMPLAVDSTLRVVEQIMPYQEAMVPFLTKLAANSPFFEKAVSLAIVDLLLSDWPDIASQLQTAQLSTAPRKSFCYSSTPAAWNMRRATAPGVPRLKTLQDQSKNTGKASAELIKEAFAHTDGTLVDILGVGQVHDYELQPQLGGVPFDAITVNHVMHAGYATQMQRFDGVVLTTSPELEPGASEILSKQLDRPVFHVGSQYPPDWWLRDKPLPETPPTAEADKEVIDFLDRMQTRYGERSVIYVSFGTFYGISKRMDLIDTLLKSLLDAEPPLPFLFAATKTRTLLSETITKRIMESDRALMIGFAPQQRVLQHDGCGWYLTHAGPSSVAEAILNKNGMVCWPMMTDQPITALHSVYCAAKNLTKLSATVALNISYELVQVRTGPSVGKMTARGVQHQGGSKESILEEMASVWQEMRTKNGQEMLSRVSDMHDRIKESWQSGAAFRGMQSFRSFL